MKFKKLAEKLSEMSIIDTVVYLAHEKNKVVKIIGREKNSEKWGMFEVQSNITDHVEVREAGTWDLMSTNEFRKEFASLNDANTEMFIFASKKPKSFMMHKF